MNVNEASTSYHTIEILADDGTVVVPESLRYKVRDIRSDIVSWTSIPTATTTITVDATTNTIGNRGSERFLIIEATHGGGKKITAIESYTLVDLKY